VSSSAVYPADGISFVLNKNERIALTGKNGAGKIDTVETDSWSTTTYQRHHLLSKEVTIGYLRNR
jgi:ATP-binding cassette subfamily F protein 3